MFKRISETLGLDALTKFDPIAFSRLIDEKIPHGFPGREIARLRLLDVMLNLGIPFNRWLGLRITAFSPQSVVVTSPPSVLRRNHVGTAHACAQALIGEYASGLVVAQRFRATEFRVIIGHLEVDYKKAGYGELKGEAFEPAVWPEVVDDAAWVEMQTEIRNTKGETVSLCRTRWQVKRWKRIKSDRAREESMKLSKEQ